MSIIELDDRYLKMIMVIFRAYPQVELVVLYGSRAMKRHKPTSDIDLAVKGHRVDIRQIGEIKRRLEEETHIPYFFDVIHYETIQNQHLKQHIDRVGKVVYRK
jgi:uncharacterized protein